MSIEKETKGYRASHFATVREIGTLIMRQDKNKNILIFTILTSGKVDKTITAKQKYLQSTKVER